MTGDNFRNVREALSLTQRAAAIRAGVTEVTWRHWEKGACLPASVAVQERVAAMFTDAAKKEGK